MPYIVIKDFKDIKDDNHIYHKGDKYPRKGKGNKERIEELASISNLIKEPVIKEMSDN